MSEPEVFRFQGPASLEWIDASGVTHTFQFDLVVQEEWKNEATVTEYPVEVGANVADHVRVELPTCTLTIFATNEPIEQNQWATPKDLDSVSVDVPSPQWIPGDGIVTYTSWRNFIDVRSLAAGILGGVAGSLASGLGGASRGIQSAVGAVAGVAAVAGVSPIPGDVAENAAALQGSAIGVFAVDAAASLVPGQAVPKTALTSAGLTPPSASPPILATVQTWPGALAGGQDFVESTVAALLALLNAAQPIIVFGTKQTEEDMIITSVSHTRGADEGSGASITLGLKKIRIVTTSVVAAPIPALPRAVTSVNKGSQNPTDAPAPVQTQAVDLVLFNKIASFLGLGGSS